jgi:hypothetical protein
MKMLSRISLIARKQSAFLRHDGIRLTAATAVVGAALFGVYVWTGSPPQPPLPDEATLAARLAESQREAALALQARRTGTILFVSSYKYCEEHRFDNTTGNTVAIDYVECEERLARDAKPDKGGDGSSAKNMQGMIASFKR